jgi:Ca2+-binding RTX toxin-like protein
MVLQVADSFTGTGIRHDLGLIDNLYIGTGIRSISTNNVAVRGAGEVHSVHVLGTLFGAFGGIIIEANGEVANSNAVVIGKTGQVGSERTAISLAGTNNSVVNYGEITSLTASAIVFGNGGTDGRISKLINRGSISGDASAVNAGGNPVLIRNYGDITGNYGPSISTGIGDDIVQNYGTLDGNVELNDGLNKVVNRGLIVGDVITGLGADTIDNRGGTITGDIRLGAGNDVFRPGAEEETVDGGADRDNLDFSRSGGVQFALDGSVVATGIASGDIYLNFENLIGSSTGADVLIGNGLANYLAGNGGNDLLSGLAGDDTLEGGHGNDILEGGIGIDELYGSFGEDVLQGGAGNDTIRGDDGNDTITGGSGKDNMAGGLGADRFVFANGDFGGRTSSTADLILDFKQAEADRIDLKLVDARSAVAGDQAFVFIGTAAFHNVAGELRFVQGTSSTVVQGDVNGDGIADFWITLTGSITLTAADFVL